MIPMHGSSVPDELRGGTRVPAPACACLHMYKPPQVFISISGQNPQNEVLRQLAHLYNEQEKRFHRDCCDVFVLRDTDFHRSPDDNGFNVPISGVGDNGRNPKSPGLGRSV